MIRTPGKINMYAVVVFKEIRKNTNKQNGPDFIEQSRQKNIADKFSAL